MARMSISKLRHVITIQAPVRTRDPLGGTTDEWSSPSVVAANLPARIESVSGREVFRGMQIESPVTHKITIRARTDVLASHRVLFGSRIFNIRAVRNISEEVDKFVQLLVEEGVAT